MKPADIRFKAMESDDGCKGCLFQKQRSAVCREASQVAQDIGQPDCDDRSPVSKLSYIYVLDESDPRQIPMLPTCEGDANAA